MPFGKRRNQLMLLFDRVLAEVIQGELRILIWPPLNRPQSWRPPAKRRADPRSRDTMIAGIVLANHAMLATRNVKHFEDIAKSVVNPWRRSFTTAVALGARYSASAPQLPPASHPDPPNLFHPLGQQFLAASCVGL